MTVSHYELKKILLFFSIYLQTIMTISHYCFEKRRFFYNYFIIALLSSTYILFFFHCGCFFEVVREGKNGEIGFFYKVYKIRAGSFGICQVSDSHKIFVS